LRLSRRRLILPRFLPPSYTLIRGYLGEKDLRVIGNSLGGLDKYAETPYYGLGHKFVRVIMHVTYRLIQGRLDVLEYLVKSHDFLVTQSR